MDLLDLQFLVDVCDKRCSTRKVSLKTVYALVVALQCFIRLKVALAAKMKQLATDGVGNPKRQAHVIKEEQEKGLKVCFEAIHLKH